MFFSNRRDIPEPEPEPENRVEGIYLSLKEFKNSLGEIDHVLGNMDGNVLQKLNYSDPPPLQDRQGNTGG